MNLEKLKAEITADPAGIGYAGMTDQQAADALNAATVSVNRSGLTGDEIFVATNPTEFGALTAEKKSLWVAFCGRATIDPFAVANVEFVKWIFGAEAATVVALGEARVTTVSRTQHLGIGFVGAHHINTVRGQ